MSALLSTPLTQWHKDHGAKTVDFAGWEMPVQYGQGIIQEHHHTRSQACVFDICHMGEFIVSGQGARESLGHIVTHNLDTLPPGKCRYGFMLNESGGVLDDLIVYCLGEDKYMLVVNASREKTDFDWCADRLAPGITLENVSASTAKIDVQGPRAIEALEAALGGNWRHLKYFNFAETTHAGSRLLLSRTGYTGELGYELYLDPANALALWEKLLESDFVQPAGFGARDTLRLEMGYPLYGHDLDEEHTPIEAGFGFLMGSKAAFIGKEAMGEPRERLIPLAITGRRAARENDEVLTLSGKRVGRVTSGCFAPSLGHAVALAYVRTEAAEHARFKITSRRAELEAAKDELPFYEKGTARTKLG